MAGQVAVQVDPGSQLAAEVRVRGDVTEHARGRHGVRERQRLQHEALCGYSRMYRRKINVIIAMIEMSQILNITILFKERCTIR